MILCNDICRCILYITTCACTCIPHQMKTNENLIPYLLRSIVANQKSSMIKLRSMPL